MTKLIGFSKARNLEFGHLYRRIMAVVERHDPDKLMISAAYEKANASVELCELLMVRSRSLPLTQEQKAKNDQMLLSVSLLKSKFELLHREPQRTVPVKEAELSKLFQSHFKSIRRIRIYNQIRLVEGFVAAVDESEDYGAIFTEMGLSLPFERLKENLAALLLVFDMHQASKNAIERGKVLNGRVKLNNLLLRLFKDIEIAAEANRDIDYTPLIKELNSEIVLSVPRTGKRVETSETEQEIVSSEDESDVA